MTLLEPTRHRGPYEGMVLKILRDEGPTSRTRLSAITGLSPTTITKTVAPLIELGLLTERADEYGGLGRPAISLVPVPEALTVCGVQLGVGKYRVGLTDARSHVRTRTVSTFDPTLPPEEVMDLIAADIRSLLAADAGPTCTGVGVGAPGPVDLARRTNIRSVNLGWSDVPISDLLEDRLEIPVVVDHNVRSLALGEARYGGHGADSLAYLYVRNGVGLGVAVKGEPFYGGHGTGGESYIGHTQVVEHGLPCSCGGRGCLDTVVAEPFIAARLAELGGAAQPEANVMSELHRRARLDPAVAALEDQVIDHLVRSMAIIVNLFTPELLLVGGSLSSAPPEVITRLREGTRDRIFPLLRNSLRVEPADGDDDALIRGAAAIALEVLHYS
ncbi:ROK family transcriptional regulator [Leifsonia aquatica]|uniref:ROK family transcriptional regulator n=1 Tax=Leifsonia aquatica TaxID=144185 RepID=UPI0028A98F02|nr:ROK family transcriptional regulator [Leifsonia aquatica]